MFLIDALFKKALMGHIIEDNKIESLQDELLYLRLTRENQSVSSICISIMVQYSILL